MRVNLNDVNSNAFIKSILAGGTPHESYILELHAKEFYRVFSIHQVLDAFINLEGAL